MAISNFSDNFPKKDWYKFGMAKNGRLNEWIPIKYPNGRRPPETGGHLKLLQRHLRYVLFGI